MKIGQFVGSICNKAVDLARKAVEVVKDNAVKAVAAVATVFGVAAASAPAHAELPSIVSYTESTGAVAFTPGAAITPVIVGVIAAVAAGVGLFIIVVGVRKIFGMLKRMG